MKRAIVAALLLAAAPLLGQQKIDSTPCKMTDGSCAGGTSSGTVLGPAGTKAVLTFANEVVPLNTGGTSTETTTKLALSDSRLEAILIRVTVAITTATAFTVKVTGGNPFKMIGTATTSLTDRTLGATYVLVPAAHDDAYPPAAGATLTVTTTGTPGAGTLSITTVSQVFTRPIS